MRQGRPHRPCPLLSRIRLDPANPGIGLKPGTGIPRIIRRPQVPLISAGNRREGQDPHGRLTDVPAAIQTATEYFHSGQAVNYCDGACDPG